MTLAALLAADLLAPARARAPPTPAEAARPIKDDWTAFRGVPGWHLTVDGPDQTPDYFGFGGVRGRLTSSNGKNLVVYYVYDDAVSPRLGSGEYAMFFQGRKCQSSSAWKEFGFPNFGFRGYVYVIDLCHTAPYLHGSPAYTALSSALVEYVERGSAKRRRQRRK